MWIESVNAIDLVIRGLVVGIVASAPMGPVGVLVVQRTLNKGRWYGFATGVGAAVSDLIYAVATGLGMSIVMDFIERPATILYLKLLGSIMLFCFGAYTYHTKSATPYKSSGKRGSLWHNMFTGFAITISNPLIIFLFLALFARVGFVVPDHPLEQALGYVGILTGALMWWICLTTVLYRLGSRFEMSTIGLFNRYLGLVVMVVSTAGLFYTLFK
ncbi:MAG: LysE family transporter [Prevotellaceae bacterium]|nr:LysE family transporter [Prevotellaceae bacterium]